MRHLTRTVPMLVIAAALCCPWAARAVPGDSLWQKAVSLSEMNDDLVPGSVKTRMQEVDKHGKPKDEEKYLESWGTLSLGEDGEVEFEIVKVIENGKDVTEEKKAEREEKKANEEDEESESHEMQD